ncbi:hypothetical protein GALL_106690 [mine drainage metagenome]|uniref:Zeta toxin n=1 Tax=mine drainage metagenome TaxID=410659 RepID=A0A1J5SFH2_9ZZZZ
MNPSPAAAQSPPVWPLGPWNPGIQSQIPRRLLPLATIFRTENVFTRIEEALERADLTALDLSELVRFRPQRLLLHELLIRVTANFSVPDGSRYEDLGINFRRMTGTILSRHLEPEMGAITAAYDAARGRLAAVIAAELAAPAAPAPVARKRSPIRKLFDLWRRDPEADAIAAPAAAFTSLTEEQAERWEARASAGLDRLEAAACRALARVATALRKRHGRPWGTPELIAAIALDLACNDYGSEEIGHLIEAHLIRAAAIEGYRLLPAQEHPFVMNTKGPSASGKSTLRPLQKQLARRIGVSWDEFALISPDIWRKQLLDYASLGADYRYGGALSGEELKIIDHKLDRYMAQKAEQGGISHLLIDRFRFDSFAHDSLQAGSNLLTRFGHIVHLFFMITSPQDIVERAWQRGLEVGRYKAVDDLLAHSVEAYSGMPQLFFTWAQREDMRVHYEFLDNGVRLGESPRTAAFGWNGRMFVLDVKAMIDVDRFCKVNINAGGPDALYPEGSRDPSAAGNTDFLVQCARRLAEIHFAEQDSGRIYLQIAAGVVVWTDPEALARAAADPQTRAGLLAVAPGALDFVADQPEQTKFVQRLLGDQQLHTLGAWGERGCDAKLAQMPIC